MNTPANTENQTTKIMWSSEALSLMNGLDATERAKVETLAVSISTGPVIEYHDVQTALSHLAITLPVVFAPPISFEVVGNKSKASF